MRSYKLKSLIAFTLTMTLVGGGILGCGTSNNKVQTDSSTEEVKNKVTIEDIRLAWYEDLTGGNNVDTENEVINKKIDGHVTKTDKHLESFNNEDQKAALWSEYENYKEVPASITSMLNNIYDMALAYSLPNEKYHKNEELKDKIIYALDWLNLNAYNSEIEQYGNWWDWMIGIPARLNNITIIMYDDLSKDQRESYMSGIQKHLPSIDPGSKLHTGANLADVCLNKLLQGVILEDSEKIKEASEDIISVLDYVESGDGFYDDGSYVQHGIVAYTGSYGNVLIDKISNLIFLLDGSEWALKSEGKANIYKWIFESFDPVIYKGYVMDMVRGRSISRHNGNGYFQATGIVEGMMKLSLKADEETAKEIQSLVKQWGMEAKESVDFGARFKSINISNKYYSVMADESIVPKEQEDNHFALNMMDKTVHERADYLFGIARSSERISKYEFMNKENLKPWFQGDGMTYLHNNDLTQFSDDFWPTINPYRMPGTTINTKEREDKIILSDFEPSAKEQDEVYYELTNSSYSGGVALGTYGASGMKIANKNDQLTANKSWFMFDDEIIALGSGITNPESFATETIVENRKLKEDGNNKIIVNGEEVGVEKDKVQSIANAKWAHLEGNVDGSDIGYAFLEDTSINILREFREGSWKDINGGDKTPDEILTNTFANIYIDHGTNAKDETYAYAILPNKSLDETKAYSEGRNIEILANDSLVQSVYNKALNIEAANFFTTEEASAGKITANKEASVILKQSDSGEFEVAVSDPTFKNEEIVVTLNIDATEVVEKDKSISNVEFVDGKVKITINTKDVNGKSFKVNLK